MDMAKMGLWIKKFTYQLLVKAKVMGPKVPGPLNIGVRCWVPGKRDKESEI
jgi:hypothetical protein